MINAHSTAHSPIYTIRAEEYNGGIRDNINHVIVAYNGNQYGSSTPVENKDP